ncbi:Dicer dimerization domain [Trinorchestia longiramus]|nr:Dicer dimerization domain [Trinorchestia longiramus]
MTEQVDCANKNFAASRNASDEPSFPSAPEDLLQWYCSTLTYHPTESCLQYEFVIKGSKVQAQLSLPVWTPVRLTVTSDEQDTKTAAKSCAAYKMSKLIARYGLLKLTGQEDGFKVVRKLWPSVFFNKTVKSTLDAKSGPSLQLCESFVETQAVMFLYSLEIVFESNNRRKFLGLLTPKKLLSTSFPEIECSYVFPIASVIFICPIHLSVENLDILKKFHVKFIENFSLKRASTILNSSQNKSLLVPMNSLRKLEIDYAVSFCSASWKSSYNEIQEATDECKLFGTLKCSCERASFVRKALSKKTAKVIQEKRTLGLPYHKIECLPAVMSDLNMINLAAEIIHEDAQTDLPLYPHTEFMWMPKLLMNYQLPEPRQIIWKAALLHNNNEKDEAKRRMEIGLSTTPLPHQLLLAINDRPPLLEALGRAFLGLQLSQFFFVSNPQWSLPVLQDALKKAMYSSNLSQAAHSSGITALMQVGDRRTSSRNKKARNVRRKKQKDKSQVTNAQCSNAAWISKPLLNLKQECKFCYVWVGSDELWREHLRSSGHDKMMKTHEEKLHQHRCLCSTIPDRAAKDVEEIDFFYEQIVAGSQIMQLNTASDEQLPEAQTTLPAVSQHSPKIPVEDFQPPWSRVNFNKNLNKCETSTDFLTPCTVHSTSNCMQCSHHQVDDFEENFLSQITLEINEPDFKMQVADISPPKPVHLDAMLPFCVAHKKSKLKFVCKQCNVFLRSDISIVLHLHSKSHDQLVKSNMSGFSPLSDDKSPLADENVILECSLCFKKMIGGSQICKHLNSNDHVKHFQTRPSSSSVRSASKLESKISTSFTDISGDPNGDHLSNRSLMYACQVCHIICRSLHAAAKHAQHSSHQAALKSWRNSPDEPEHDQTKQSLKDHFVPELDHWAESMAEQDGYFATLVCKACDFTDKSIVNIKNHLDATSHIEQLASELLTLPKNDDQQQRGHSRRQMHELVQLVCGLCKKTYHGTGHILKHIRSLKHSRAVTASLCPAISYSMWERKLSMYGRFDCIFCEMKFTSMDHFVRSDHMEKELKSIEEASKTLLFVEKGRLWCCVCQLMAANVELMKKHCASSSHFRCVFRRCLPSPRSKSVICPSAASMNERRPSLLADNNKTSAPGDSVVPHLRNDTSIATFGGARVTLLDSSTATDVASTECLKYHRDTVSFDHKTAPDVKLGLNMRGMELSITGNHASVLEKEETIGCKEKNEKEIENWQFCCSFCQWRAHSLAHLKAHVHGKLCEEMQPLNEVNAQAELQPGGIVNLENCVKAEDTCQKAGTDSRRSALDVSCFNLRVAQCGLTSSCPARSYSTSDLTSWPSSEKTTTTNQRGSSSLVLKSTSKSLTCALCDTICSSEENFGRHINSKMHKRVLSSTIQTLLWLRAEEKLVKIGDPSHESLIECSQNIASVPNNHEEGFVDSVSSEQTASSSLSTVPTSISDLNSVCTTADETDDHFTDTVARNQKTQDSPERASLTSSAVEEISAQANTDDLLSQTATVDNLVSDNSLPENQLEKNAVSSSGRVTSSKPTRNCTKNKLAEINKLRSAALSTIGCVLLCCGSDAAMQTIWWLECRVTELPAPETAMSIISDRAAAQECLWHLMHDRSLHQLEDIIGYTFRSKTFLLAALTHPSYTSNKCTDCYERLSFLGAAVLQYLAALLCLDPRFDRKVEQIIWRVCSDGWLAEACARHPLCTFFLHDCPPLAAALETVTNVLGGTGNSTSSSPAPEESHSSTPGPRYSTGEPLNKPVAPFTNAFQGLTKKMQNNLKEVLASLVRALLAAVYLDSGYSWVAVGDVACQVLPLNTIRKF